MSVIPKSSTVAKQDLSRFVNPTYPDWLFASGLPFERASDSWYGYKPRVPTCPLSTNATLQCMPFTSSPKQLASYLGDCLALRGNDLMPIQQKIISRFHALGRCITKNMPLEQSNILEGFFELFDDIFFNGLLKAWVKVEIQTGTLLKSHGVTRLSGESIPNRYAALIILRNKVESPFHREKGWDAPTSLHQYHITLLHEMVHAFRHIYSCRCSDKCNNIKTSREGIGATGHGICWAKLAQSVEIAATEILDKRLDWDLRQIWNICRRGGFEPLEVCEALGFVKSADVLECIKRCKEQMEVTIPTRLL
ncbi:hypothetical protein BJ875DRAFT_438537 [Amylocarpus encephaloides]|uniref:SprT-like domain-containing protein n=1 Tax=Amylocarpus encephaloides TaxID=45428 RepID=A0A9P7YQQ2_9HELO|nr:hypothetical protein BJ875DRAFT_438537 [Amylocarpus encephaloides]